MTPPKRSSLGSFPDDVHAIVVGASGGIGAALLDRLSSEPRLASVIATAREPTRIAPLNGDPRLERTALDLTDEASLADLAARVASHARAVRLIVVATGLLHRGQPHLSPEKRLSDLDPAAMLDSYRVNALGPLLLAKHLLPHLPRRGRTVFAVLSARVGSIGDNRLGGWYHYRMSKAALNMGLRTAAIEASRHSPESVVVCLHPGTVDTALSEPFQRSVPPDKLFSAERAACQLLEVVDRLGPADSGHFFAWDGSEIPW